MSEYQWFLLGHLIAAFAFVSGAVLAGVLQWAAFHRDRPSEILILLRLIRPAVLVITVAAFATLGFGLALAHHLGATSALWVRSAVVLWIVSVIFGGTGGGRQRQARYLAQALATRGDAPSAELKRALRDPISLALNSVSFAALLAILVVMVWQPK